MRSRAISLSEKMKCSCSLSVNKWNLKTFPFFLSVWKRASTFVGDGELVCFIFYSFRVCQVFMSACNILWLILKKNVYRWYTSLSCVSSLNNLNNKSLFYICKCVSSTRFGSSFFFQQFAACQVTRSRRRSLLNNIYSRVLRVRFVCSCYATVTFQIHVYKFIAARMFPEV